MKRAWFRSAGWVYKPISTGGWVTTIVLVLFCLQVFVGIDRYSDSVSDTLYGIFPYWVPAFLLWLWIGSKTSGESL